ncbi:MAG: DUF1674 domain-containing protein [Gammaproteobacteria bacterium]|jgi:hypothetical protein|nr:DUF1674 domain-containing protein [Gammaproteobacteria bacterium]
MSKQPPETAPETDDGAREEPADTPSPGDDAPKEIGGRQGPDPTRYGDWEKGGRCIDF